jgi:hypothetical protein
MTHARRARLGLIRCENQARIAARRGYGQLAADFTACAEDWRAFLIDLDAPTEAACEECGAAEGEDCDPDCDCDTCQVQRALDDDVDRWIDDARSDW